MRAAGKRLCPRCAKETTFDLCLEHLATDETWASGNRILCDLFHRGVVPVRMPEGDRENPAVTELRVP